MFTTKIRKNGDRVIKINYLQFKVVSGVFVVLGCFLFPMIISVSSNQILWKEMFSTMFAITLFVSLVFIGVYFLLILPLRILIIRNKKSLLIKKRGWFYREKVFHITNLENLSLIYRKAYEIIFTGGNILSMIDRGPFYYVFVEHEDQRLKDKIIGLALKEVEISDEIFVAPFSWDNGTLAFIRSAFNAYEVKKLSNFLNIPSNFT